MLNTIRDLLYKEEIMLAAPVALSDCHIQRRYLLKHAGIEDGTVIMMAVPYAVQTADSGNLSAYAAVPDYHFFFEELFSRLLPRLHALFPTNRFAGFSDHSPLDEVDAALRAGLGVRGDHGLLITVPYSSYIFLGELITDAILPTTTIAPRECNHCGACRRACPSSLDKTACLSALTQKKGLLTEDEQARLRAHPTVWGCDICQQVCPYTAAAKAGGTLYAAPAWFRRDLMPQLDMESLDKMDETTFARRAFAWRGRAVIRRNLLLKGDIES